MPTAVALPFHAIGQEPGWVLDLDERQMRFAGDYGATNISVPVPLVVRGAESGAVTYSVKSEEHELVLIVREAPCQDAMSGERFTHTATVRWNGKELQGCGRVMVTGNALNTYWKLAELGGVPAVAVAGPREPHYS